MKRKRKLICIEDTGRVVFGGGQRTTIHIINKINKIFDQVYIFDRGNSLKLNIFCKKSNVIYKGFKFNKYFFGLPQFFVELLLLILKIKENNNVVLYSTTRFSTLFIGIISIFISRRYKWIAHEHMVSPKNKLISNIFSKFLFSSDYQIFPSLHCKESYKFANKEKINKYAIIYGEEIVSELPEYSNDDLLVKARVSEFEEESNIYNATKIIYSGRISEKKGIFKLINMFTTCKSNNLKNGGNAILFIAGFGNKKIIEELKKLIIDEPLICYLGQLNISQRFYTYFDLGINPSWEVDESLGLSAIEILNYNGKLLTSRCASLKNFEKYGGLIYLEPNDNIYKKIEEINQINKSNYKYLKRSNINHKKLEEIFS